jgi:hypothetical protein
MTLGEQVVSLLILAVPVACVSWTVTHEEIFREPREYCKERSQNCRRLLERKFFYLFTCEYCFSHYISAIFLWIAGYKLLFDDWRGYMFAWFALVWMANQYMSIFGRLRLDIKRERVEIESVEEEVKAIKQETGSANSDDGSRRVA